MFHHDNLVRVDNGRKTMSNRQRASSFGLCGVSTVKSDGVLPKSPGRPEHVESLAQSRYQVHLSPRQEPDHHQ